MLVFLWHLIAPNWGNGGVGIPEEVMDALAPVSETMRTEEGVGASILIQKL